jgi:hypothetical protein
MAVELLKRSAVLRGAESRLDKRLSISSTRRIVFLLKRGNSVAHQLARESARNYNDILINFGFQDITTVFAIFSVFDI